MAPRLEHPEAVWVLDGSDFPKHRKSVGVTRQYCTAGQGGQLPGGDVLGIRESRWAGRLVDKRLYLPENWTSDRGRCGCGSAGREASVPVEDGVGLL